jgi:cytochrome c551/c552
LRLERFLVWAVLGFPFHSGIAQGPDKLTSGPGSTLTENKCKICHELQHIRRTPLSRGEWADNLKNMRERGTPMTDEELAIILDYLSLYYSRDPAPSPTPDSLSTAGSDPIAKLLEAHACGGCHSLDKRVVGPSFREIAQRYAGDAGAAARLAVKVRSGGQGAWGQVPMPAAAGIADPDLAMLLDWVLGQK